MSAFDLSTLFQQAIALHQGGQLDEAREIYQSILRQQPEHADAWHCLGIIAIQSGDPSRAVECICKAIAANSKHFGYYLNYGSALTALGRLDAAVDSYDHAIALRADIADAHFNRAVALQGLGQLDAACAGYDQTLALQPTFSGAHRNRGIAMQELGRLDAAVASFDQAIALAPDDAHAHAGRGLALLHHKQLEAAVASFERAVALNPDYALAHAYCGTALKDLKRSQAAVASYDRAIALKPDYAEAYLNRGIALDDWGKVDEAEVSFRRAIAIDPQLSAAHHSLAFLKQTMGDTQAAIQSYRCALACKPDRDDSHTGLLYCLSSDADVTPAALFAEYQRFGAQFEGSLRADWQTHGNVKDPSRRLHIGFVSGDFFTHAAATFIEPVLQELGKSSQFTLHAYYNYTVQDAVTQRLQSCCTHWNGVADLSDEALAQRIRADGIDILIDLSGHTARHRLCMFAHKPAPIQVTWIGFPGTSGLQAMDYHFTDRHFLPSGAYDNQFTEKLVYLNTAVSFLPYEGAPALNALPALRNGYLTFGSFNRRNKITSRVVALWAQVLRALPDSRMVLGAMETGQEVGLQQCFAAESIAPERLRFVSKSDMLAYLGLHHAVDICLDTFPYTGLNTTLHALWMGVPTLSLCGNTPIARQGNLVLGHLGLSTFLGQNSQEFVACAVHWASQLDALAQLRASLRGRLTATALGQPAILVADLERALRTMWERWCNQQPAVSFCVDQALDVSVAVSCE